LAGSLNGERLQLEERDDSCLETDKRGRHIAKPFPSFSSFREANFDQEAPSKIRFKIVSAASSSGELPSPLAGLRLSRLSEKSHTLPLGTQLLNCLPVEQA